MKPRQFSTLLTEENVVPFHKMEEAFQRQVLFGGRLGTNLLEIGALDEQTLLHYLGESSGLAWADRNLLMNLDPQVVDRLPLEEIEWLGVLPIRELDGTLQCLVIDPPSLETEDTLRSHFSTPFELFITNEFRFAELCERLLERPLPDRYRKLLGRFPLEDSPEFVEDDEDDFWAGFGLEDTSSQTDFSQVAAALAQGEDWGQGETQDTDEDAPPSPAQEELPPAPPQRTSRSRIANALDTFLERFNSATERDELIHTLLELIALEGHRGMALTVGSQIMRGFASRGFSLDRVTVRKLRVACHGNSDLEHVRSGESYFLGEAVNAPELRDIYLQLGGDLPEEILVTPIHVSQRVPLALLVQSVDTPFSQDMLDALFQAIHALSNHLERLILEKKRQSLTEAPAPAQGPIISTPDPATQLPAGSQAEAQPEAPLADIFRPRKSRTAASTTPPPPPSVPPRPVTLETEAVQPVEDELIEIDLGDSLIPLDAEPANVIIDFDYWTSRLDSDDPEVARQAREYLARDEPGALDALMSRFPGNLKLARFHHARNMPPASEHSSILACLLQHPNTLVSRLIPLLDSAKPDERFYALLLFSELRDETVLKHLNDRFFDKDPQVRRVALATLKQWRNHNAFDALRLRLELTLAEDNIRVLELSCQALGELRDLRSLPVLLPLLEHENGHIVESAHRAMVAIALDNPGQSMRKWRRWLDQFTDTPRILMLAEAMLHKDRAIRALVLDELSAFPILINYHPDASRRERNIAREQLLEYAQRSHEASSPPP